MNTTQFDSLGNRLKYSMLAALFFSPAVTAQSYECMLVQSRPVKESLSQEDIHARNIAVDEVIVEGTNFGSNPRVYFGTEARPAEILSVDRNNGLDSITLKLPQSTTYGTYKLIVQNTTGPFFENDGFWNPIFCFGSVTVRVKIKRIGS
ncbi:MAG: hypothetical protein ACRERV_13370 [Methylococcales bacterium]